MMYFLVNVLSFLLWMTADAHSAPIFGAIAAFASTTLGGFILQAVVGIALKLGASLLANLGKKNDKPETKQPSTSLTVRVGGDNPLQFPLGTAASAGLRVYAGSWGNNSDVPNEFFTEVYGLSVIPVASPNLVGLWIDDQRVTIMTGEVRQPQGYPILEYRRDGKDYAWVDFYDGKQTTVNAYLVDKFGAHPVYPWESDMIGRGVAYATFTARFDQELWITGQPQLLFEVPSIPLYDVRKDSTAGGSGSHRWGNVATYEASNNRMVQAYNIARGVYYGTQWIYGGQNWPAFRFPASSWMAGMNACDATRTLDGSTEPSFHGGGIVECDIVPVDTIEELLRSSSGLISENGGILKIRIGAPGAPVYAITDDNIVVTREQGYSPFPPLSETYNIINATYSDKTQRWATKDAPPRRDNSFIVADDGRELPISINLPWVQSNTTVQAIQLTALKNGRRWRVHQQYLPPEAWLLEPLDTIAWSSAHNGYIDKEFEIEEIGGESNFLQFVRIRENDPSDYDWNPVTDELPSPVVVPVTVRPNPQVMAGWSAVPSSVVDNGATSRRPAIQVGYAGNLVDVRAVRVQVRLLGTTGIVFDGESPYNSTSPTAKLSGDWCLPNTSYEVRGKYVPISARSTLWSNQDSTPPYAQGPWITVLTGNILLQPDIDFVFDGVVGFENLKPELAEFQEWIGGNVRDLVTATQDAITLLSDQALMNYQDKETLRIEVKASYELSTAEYTNAITAATGPGSAIVQRIETLEVYVNTTVASAVSALQVQIDQQGDDIDAQAIAITDLSTRIGDAEDDISAQATATSLLTTRVTNAEGDISAQATALTNLTATVNGVSASANFRASVYAGPAGYSSRIGLEARVGGTGTYRSASLFLDVPASTSSPTRVAIMADQFIVTDGTTNASPFIVSGGIARMNMANIGTVTAGIVQSSDGKMIINLTNSNIIMSD